jgi:hypothetical protein
MIMSYTKTYKVKDIQGNKLRCIGKNKNGQKCKRFALVGEYCCRHFELKLKESGTNENKKRINIE